MAVEHHSGMVGFICQLDWAMEYKDIWLNIILGVSVTVFLDEINISISRLKTVNCPP